MWLLTKIIRKTYLLRPKTTSILLGNFMLFCKLVLYIRICRYNCCLSHWLDNLPSMIIVVYKKFTMWHMIWVLFNISYMLSFVWLKDNHIFWQQPHVAVLSRINLGKPIIFVLYINVLPDNMISEVFMFADETKVIREIRPNEDMQTLQRNLDKLQVWPNKWLLRFHPDKCKKMTISRKKKQDQTNIQKQ